MFPGFEYFLVAGAVLLILSVLASKLSDRFGIPTLLIFLGIGMLAGSDGPGGIYFDNAALAQAVGVVALVIILFSGGLDTHWERIVPVIKQGLSLATLGVLTTALLMGVAAHLILNVPLSEGILLGAIVSSTDAAAVFSIIDTSGIQLKGRLGELLEFESGSNDPMAVFLTVGLVALIQNPDRSPLTLLPLFLQQILIGGIIGFFAGQLMLLFFHRLNLANEELYPILALGVILLTYGISTLLHGSGFLAVYLAGLMIARDKVFNKRLILRFFDSLAGLSQIIMFLTLGLLVFPSRLAAVLLPGLGLALILILVARPLSVALSLAFARLGFREKTFISWVGLRGAVPIVLATYPELAGLERSGLIFNVVFFVVLTSVLVQGTTLRKAARWLRVEASEEMVEGEQISTIKE